MPDHSFTINHLSFGDKKDFDKIKNNFLDTDIKHPLDGFIAIAGKKELLVIKEGHMITEYTPKPMSVMIFIDAVPSTFKSNLGSMFDTEVFQLKAAQETDLESKDNVVVFNYQIS